MSKNNQTKNKYNRIANVYNFFTGGRDSSKISTWTQRMIDNLEGKKILEVGVGTGKVARHYPDHLEVVGIDFSKNMLKRAEKEVINKDNVTLFEMDAQKMTFEDNSFDTVVASCVFCAVPNPILGMSEMQRVCKANGKIIMVEHVRSEKVIKGKIMDWLNIITAKIMGEHINRDTENNLLIAGFNRNDIKSDYIYSDIVKFITIRNKK